MINIVLLKNWLRFSFKGGSLGSAGSRWSREREVCARQAPCEMLIRCQMWLSNRCLDTECKVKGELAADTLLNGDV